MTHKWSELAIRSMSEASDFPAGAFRDVTILALEFTCRFDRLSTIVHRYPVVNRVSSSRPVSHRGSRVDIDAGLSHPAATRLRSGRQPWPSPQHPQLVPIVDASPRQFLSSASRLGRDRRDPDHGRARGRGAICHGRADRAHLSAGAHREAARPRASPRSKTRPASCSTPCSRTTWPSGSKRNAASSACRACRFSIRCWRCSSPISAPKSTHARRRAAHAQCRIFQANRRAQLHHAAR